MQITLSSVMVDDQDKALAFHTETLGFEKKHDIPMGPVTGALLEDTCDNLVNLVQPAA